MCSLETVGTGCNNMNFTEAVVSVYKTEIIRLLPESLVPFIYLLPNFDYHPWVFSVIGSILIGLSGVLPMFIINIDDGANLKTGGHKSAGVAPSFYIMIRLILLMLALLKLFRLTVMQTCQDRSIVCRSLQIDKNLTTPRDPPTKSINKWNWRNNKTWPQVKLQRCALIKQIAMLALQHDLLQQLKCKSQRTIEVMMEREGNSPNDNANVWVGEPE